MSGLVGGIDVLETLATDPLPFEAIESSGVDGALRAHVEAIAAAVESFANRFSFVEVADAEYRTIVARLVDRILARAPRELLRSTPERLGAALVWLAMHGNDDLGRRRAGLTAAFIWGGFGVGPASDLGRRLHRATGVELPEVSLDAPSPVWLADVALLHSRTRRALVTRRDGLVRSIEDAADRRRAMAPVQRTADGSVAIQGHPTAPQIVVRSADPSGRDIVALVFGTDATDVEARFVSVPDAHRLVQMLQRALDMTVDRVSPPRSA